MKKIKAGLALLTAEWFSQIRLDVTADSSSNIISVVQENTRLALETLSAHFELVHPKTITTVKDAKEACEDYRRENVQLIILSSLIYSGDDTIVEIARSMTGVPFLVWSFHPDYRLQQINNMARYFRVTGAAGMLQGCSALKRINIPMRFLFGAPGSEKLHRELENIAAACAVRCELKALQIAAVGRRYEPMSAAWSEEFRLKTTLGPRIVWISAAEYAAVAAAVPNAEVKAFLMEQTEKYRVVDVPDDALEAAARASMAGFYICKKYNCGVLSIQDMDEELHALLGVRPQMSYPPIFEAGIAVGMEQDINAALCTWMVGQLTDGEPTMYGEIFTYNEAENELIVGHASIHDLRLAGNHEIQLVQDGEFNHADRYVGVWNEFICKAGAVTMTALFAGNDGYHIITCSGTSIESPKWIPGNVHARVRLNLPLEFFLQKVMCLGVTQHFAVCYGDIKPRMEELARQMNIAYYDIDRIYDRGPACENGCKAGCGCACRCV